MYLGYFLSVKFAVPVFASEKMITEDSLGLLLYFSPEVMVTSTRGEGERTLGDAYLKRHASNYVHFWTNLVAD